MQKSLVYGSGFSHFWQMEFPIYLKDPNGSLWYALRAKNAFTQYQGIGERTDISSLMRSEIEDGDYATALYIQDLISAAEEGRLMQISESEFIQATGEASSKD